LRYLEKNGRVFFTFHPEAQYETSLAELIDGQPIPFPSVDFQKNFKTLLSIRIDEKNDVLWALDFGFHGYWDAQFFAFRISDGMLVDNFTFPREIVGLGSMMNDFAIHPKLPLIYIAESSLFGKTPALIIYDVEKKEARRVLENHVSVTAKPYDLTVEYAKRDMVVLGVFGIRPGVDSIALDSSGEKLYFASVSDTQMFRIDTSYLNNPKLSSEILESKVEVYSNKTESDGIIADSSYVYITDPAHSAILRLKISENKEERTLETIFKEGPLLRWPDGMSFGPKDSIYFSCSSLENVILRTSSHIKSNAPYQIFKFSNGDIPSSK